jgi:signal transduction histidine kinase
MGARTSPFPKGTAEKHTGTTPVPPYADESNSGTGRRRRESSESLTRPRRESGAPGASSTALTGLDPDQLATLLDQSSEPQIVLGATGRVLAVNVAATRVLGVARDQMIGAALSSCARGLSTEALRGTLASGIERPLKMQGKLGQELSGTVVPLRDAHGQPSAFCLTLTGNERSPFGTLASVVRLTGELGHDLNNQLAAVLNYAFVVERRLGAASKDTSHLADLRAAAWRAAGLTRWLQLGGRRPGLGAEPLGVSTLLAGIEPLARHLARDVPLELRVATPRVEIWAALRDVELVVVSLIGAALERVTSDGRIELSATPSLDGEAVRISCSWSASLAAHRAARGARPHAHGSLRRALRRSNARMGHDDNAVWADFPASPGF